MQNYVPSPTAKQIPCWMNNCLDFSNVMWYSATFLPIAAVSSWSGCWHCFLRDVQYIPSRDLNMFHYCIGVGIVWWTCRHVSLIIDVLSIVRHIAKNLGGFWEEISFRGPHLFLKYFYFPFGPGCIESREIETPFFYLVL